MNKNVIRVVILLGAVLLIILFQRFHLGDHFTLEKLKENHEAIRTEYSKSPLLVVAIYFLIYVVVVTASLPGAGIMSLAGGALFGFWVGLGAAALASTIGATCAFLMARFLFRDFVARRFKKIVDSVDNGVRKEGAIYLVTLRFIPIFPFFAINLVMGLTQMKVLTYFVATLFGSLLGTLILVNAGTQLARVTSLHGILSPGLLVSLAALGLLPLLTKRIIEFIRARKTPPSPIDVNPAK